MPELPPRLAWQALLATKVAATDGSLTGFGRYARLLTWLETLPDPSLTLASYPWRQLEQLTIRHTNGGNAAGRG